MQWKKEKLFVGLYWQYCWFVRCFIYSIVTDPLGEHDIMLALAVTAGFIALEQDKRKER